jgi:hypothetical protein
MTIRSAHDGRTSKHSQTKDHYQIYGSGISIPLRIADAVNSGQIKPHDLHLLVLIDSLTNPITGEGCWAGNKYLATRLNRTEWYTRVKIGGLCRRGLIIRQKDKSGRRILWTVYTYAVLEKTNTISNTDSYYPTGNTQKRGRALAALATPVEDDDMLFALEEHPLDKKKSERTQTTEFDENCARQLRMITELNHPRKRPYSLSKWADQFRRLRQSLKQKNPEKQITRVLNWYEKNAPNLEKPLIGNAKEFDNCFIWLTELMEKGEDVEPLPLSADAKYILKVITNFKWPKVTSEQLAQAVERSVQNHKKLQDQRRTIRDHLKEQAQVLRDIGVDALDNSIATQLERDRFFLEWVAQEMGHTGPYLARWFEKVRKNVKDWAEWSGNLKSFIFHVDHKWFQQQGTEWTTRFGDKETWGRFMERVKDANRKV